MTNHLNDTKLLTSTVAAALLALVVAATPAAAAKPVTYKGKTKDGTAVTFKKAGGAVQRLQTDVPVMCVSSRTSDTRAGSETYAPPGKIRIGGEQTVAAEQYVSMGMGETATKTYRVTLSRTPKGAIRGKLSVSFMAIEPYYNAWGHLDGNTFVCQGSTTFSARPR